MEYELTRLVTGTEGVVPISKEQYEEIASAKEKLLTMLFIEQKFDLVVEDFLELETELLSSSARFLMYGGTNFHWLQSEKSLINRRLVNLLSVCRAYIDYAQPNGSKLLVEESQQALEFDDTFSKHYDSNFGYRVMEAMRNYVQHRGFPIHAIEYSADRSKQSSRNGSRYQVAIYTKTIYLKDDRFKAKVLKELDALGGRVDVKPLVRDYVECLAQIHERLRAMLTDSLPTWEVQYMKAIEQFKTSFPQAPLNGLVAVEIDGPNRRNEINLSSEFLEHRKLLEAKNQGFVNLGRRYVSGEVKGGD